MNGSENTQKPRITQQYHCDDDHTNLGNGAEIEISQLGYLRDDVKMIIAEFFDRISVQSHAHQSGQICQLVHLHHIRDSVSVQIEHFEVGELEDLGVDEGECVEGDVEPSEGRRVDEERVESFRGAGERLDLVVVETQRCRRKQRALGVVVGFIGGRGGSRLSGQK